MRTTRWLAAEILITVASAGVGWLIPDGLSRLASLMSQDPLLVTPTERLLSAMVAFVFALSLQLMLTVRSEMRATREGLPVDIKRLLDSSVLKIFLDNVDESPQGLARFEHLIKSAVAPFARAHAGLFDAYAVIVERALANATRDVRRLSGEGLEVDILDNVEVTQRLAADCSRYRQIQRQAFLVPGEWTQAWMRFVATLGVQDISCEYVVLMRRDEFLAQRRRLDSMAAYLGRYHWAFKYCDLQDVLDSFGGKLPTEFNLEVFDDRVVKIQELPEGAYQGGVKLKMALFGLDQRAELRRLDACVTRYSKPYSASLFEGDRVLGAEVPGKHVEPPGHVGDRISNQ